MGSFLFSFVSGNLLSIVDYTFAKQLIGILQYINLWTNNQLFLIGFSRNPVSCSVPQILVGHRNISWGDLWEVCCSLAGRCMYFLFLLSICYQCMYSSSHLVTSPRLMARKLVITHTWWFHNNTLLMMFSYFLLHLMLFVISGWEHSIMNVWKWAVQIATIAVLRDRSWLLERVYLCILANFSCQRNMN